MKGEPADIPEAVKKYELTGGNIINIVQYTCIRAIEALQKTAVPVPEPVVPVDSGGPEGSGFYGGSSGDAGGAPRLTIYLSDVLDGIKRELLKEGKPFAM